MPMAVNAGLHINIYIAARQGLAKRHPAIRRRSSSHGEPRKKPQVFCVQYHVGRKFKRRGLGTDSLAVAQDKLRQFESGLVRGEA
jgi:hypothetical protein